MSDQDHLKRFGKREFLRAMAAGAGLAAFTPILQACGAPAAPTAAPPAAAPTPQVVEKEVTKVVEKPVEVTKIVEKQVTQVVVATPTVRQLQAASLLMFASLQIEQEPFVRQVVNDFTRQNSKVKVEFTNMPGADYEKALLTRAASNTLPDVMLISSPLAQQWYEKKLLLDIDDFVKRDSREVNPDDFWPTQLPELKYRKNGHWTGLPFDFSNVAMAYNRNIFDELGLAYPTADWTWQTILDMGLKINKIDASGKQTRFGTSRLPGGWWIDAFLRTEGGAFLNDEWDKVVVNTPETAEALQFWADMNTKHKVVADIAGNGTGQMFYSGLIGIQMCGSWDNLPFRENIKDRFKWDVMYLPKGRKTGKVVVVAGGAQWIVGGQTKFQEESWQLLKHITTTQALEIYISRLLRSIPGRQSAIAAYVETAKAGGLDPEHAEVFPESLKMARIIPQVPFDKELGVIQKNYLDQIFLGKATAKEVLPKWEQESNDAIAKYR